MKKVTARQGKPVPFFKLHGAGNDILVVQGKDFPAQRKAAFVQRITCRQTGLGADQLLEVLSRRPLAARIWNKDGSQAEMCANGLRVLLFLAEKEGWIPKVKGEIPVSVAGRIYRGEKRGSEFELGLGEPLVGGLSQLELEDESIPFYPVSVGNPHAVIFLGEGQGQWQGRNFLLSRQGPLVETHPRFPRKTNVEFVSGLQVKGRRATVTAQVWERGAGATLSCGSGAVAVAAVVRDILGATQVAVKMTKFTLKVRFEGANAYLSGPVALIAKGFYFP